MSTEKIAVNGVLHDWESVTVVGPQGTFIGITEIAWKSKQEKENRYGKGGVPRGVGRKNYEPDASMTLDPDEYDRLVAALGGAPYRKSFIMEIHMEPPDATSSSVTLQGVMINDLDQSGKQGESKVEIKVSMRVAMILRDGTPEYEE